MTVQPRQCVAVIPGASAGVRMAAALALAGQGWRLPGVGRDPGQSVATRLRQWSETLLVTRGFGPIRA